MIARRFSHIASLCLLLMALCLCAPKTFAACTDPARSEGAIVYNSAYNVPQVCAGSTWVSLGRLNPAAGGGSCTNPARTEGAIVYNVDYKLLQFCDGTNWIGVGQALFGGCLAPTDCAAIGDVCTDGSLFAGFIADVDGTCRVIYVTDTNQSAGTTWKTTTGTDDITPDDHFDGSNNHASRAGNLTDFPAFDLCESNTYHGKDDWYLPSANEAQILAENRAAIDANAAQNFQAGAYWTSTEYNTTQAFRKDIANHAFLSNHGKDNTQDVRCIRSALSQASSGGGGGGGGGGSCTPGSTSFTTAGTHSYGVDSSISGCKFTITVKGAGGSGTSVGGTTVFDYEPGTTGTFNVYVGAGGSVSSSSTLGGGGGGGTGFNTGGSGGGASSILFDTTLLAVAGGGGGKGDGGSQGGNGGALNSAGGTATSGGAGGSSGTGGNGDNDGGDGGDSTTTPSGTNGADASGGSGQGGSAQTTYGIAGGGGGGGGGTDDGGGGGGGGYGGGGGGQGGFTNGDGGGGGGGYLNLAVTNNSSSGTGLTGDGEVLINWTNP